MKKRTASALAALLVGCLALTGCGGGRTESTTSSGGSAAAKGFAADSTIGVALPWLGTQNWKEAETMFTAQLTTAGFKPLVQAADSKVTQQQQQIEAMIEKGAKVIVVGSVDGTQLGSVLEKAKASGVSIIGYDRLIQNTAAVDAVVQFGSVKTGEMQGQSLLDGLKERKGSGPYNIELFAGGPADANAPDFFKGAMSVLQPKIDDGTLKLVSGQKDVHPGRHSRLGQRQGSVAHGFAAVRVLLRQEGGRRPVAERRHCPRHPDVVQAGRLHDRRSSCGGRS